MSMVEFERDDSWRGGRFGSKPATDVPLHGVSAEALLRGKVYAAAISAFPGLTGKDLRALVESKLAELGQPAGGQP